MKSLKHALLTSLLTGKSSDYFNPKSSFYRLPQEQQSLVMAALRHFRPQVEALAEKGDDAVSHSDKLFRFVRGNSDLPASLLTYVVRGLMRVTGYQGMIDSVYASRKRAYGYFNFEWQGNDALLFSPDRKKTVLLSGKAARDFENELERIEDEIPHDEALEPAVNDFIKGYFTPPE